MARYLSIIWHFHQPYYISGKTAVLPWVRLHTVKNYLPMALILAEFPDVRCTINVTPSLLEQLKLPAEDFYLSLSSKPVKNLTPQEKEFIMSKFFMCNFDKMIKPYPRYLELYEKKLSERHFSDQDILDLTVYFNLTWTSQILIEKDQQLNKASHFTESDRQYILEIHRKSIDQTLGKLRELYVTGQIELITSPFYHSILPLLIKYELAEDAKDQVHKSLEYFESIFDRKPDGMWPSELALSEDAARLVKDQGIKWIVADEDLTDSPNKNIPNNFEGINVFFRSKYLSNLISFTYKDFETEKATSHIIEQIETISKQLPDNSIVTIALDGENPWEHYKNGTEFLKGFYKKLQNSETIVTTTPSIYLSKITESNPISKLGTGSWINNSLDVWSAHEEDKKGWQLLKQVRKEKGVSKQILVSEGSDWFWWFGPEFSTPLGAEFDMLFRRNLAACYEKPPLELFYPVKNLETSNVFTKPWALLQVELDGRITDYFEWLAAGKYNFVNEHDPECKFNQIMFGNDEKNLYICINPNNIDTSKLTFHFMQPKKISIRTHDGKFILDHVLEVCYPLEKLGVKEGDVLEFFMEYDGKVFPSIMPLCFNMLSSETKKVNWSL